MFSFWKDVEPGPPVMASGGTESLAVSRLPICDYCLDWAEFHGESVHGRRANMCVRHFKLKGKGRHQKLVLVHTSSRSHFRTM